MKIAVVVMASWGDVIISTLIPRAIREQRPDWRITYITSSACAGAIENNARLDNLIIIPATKDQAWGMQDRVIADARATYDKVITPWAGWYPQNDWLPLPSPGPNGSGWDGAYHHSFMWAYVRTAQLEGLHIPNPPTIELFLRPTEVKRAEQFANSLNRHRPTVLLETEGHSSQSWLNQSWLRPIMETITAKIGPVNLLISKGGPETPEITTLKAAYPGCVHLLNDYSLREVAVIFNSCDIFIGCSSGTSNACHSQFCRRDVQWFESVKSTLWDSRPLGTHRKTIYYGEDPAGFFDLLRDKVR